MNSKRWDTHETCIFSNGNIYKFDSFNAIEDRPGAGAWYTAGLTYYEEYRLLKEG